MSLEMQFNGAYRLRAFAKHTLGIHTVETECIEIGGKVTRLPTVVFNSMDPQAERKATAYAAAINTVDAAFHPQKIAEPA